MKTELTKYILLTGSNLGNRKALLEQASDMISSKIGRIIATSSLIETEAWGFESDSLFLNQALMIQTELKPQQILSQILRIESQMGRVRETKQWTSRIIDIDILCGENVVHNTETLLIPHKFLQHRDFALQPLCEIAEGWKHPVLRKSYGQLLTELKDTSTTEIPQNANP